MKKVLLFVLAFMVVFSFTNTAKAQMLTEDLVFLKVGYIPVSQLTATEKEDYSAKIPPNIADGKKDEADYEGSGFGIQAEYNVVVSQGFWLGIGMEYQKIKYEEGSGTDKVETETTFIQPMVSLKVAAAGGLYLGAGISGKYTLNAGELDLGSNDNPEWKKSFDVWANGILGFYTAVAEAVYLDIEARFGYNITNNQFTELEDSSSNKYKFDVGSCYDMAIYVGIGFNPTGGGGI